MPTIRNPLSMKPKAAIRLGTEARRNRRASRKVSMPAVQSRRIALQTKVRSKGTARRSRLMG